jgi:hypothetical protein
MLATLRSLADELRTATVERKNALIKDGIFKALVALIHLHLNDPNAVSPPRSGSGPFSPTGN